MALDFGTGISVIWESAYPRAHHISSDEGDSASTEVDYTASSKVLKRLVKGCVFDAMLTK